MSLRQAQADVDTVAARIRAEYPRRYKDESVRVVSLQSELIRDVKTVLWILLGALGFVLLIGCANTGNLLLARAVSREKEMAVRTALGAGRLALVRQMLTEAMLLALGGGLLGLLLAFWGLRAILAVLPPALYVPRLNAAAFDSRVLIFTAAVSVLATAVFGVIPSLRLSRPDLSQTIASGRIQKLAGRVFPLRPGSVLLVSEVALILPMLVGTALLTKSLGKLLEVNRDYQPEQLLAMQVGFPNTFLQSLSSFRTVASLSQQFEQRVAGMPGVRSVAAVDYFPPLTEQNPNRFKSDGAGVISENYEPAEMHVVTPSYFQMLGTRLVRGRWLADDDTYDSLRVAVINEAMAKRYWRDADPISRRLTPMFRWTSENFAYTIVGIIREPKRFGSGENPAPAVYVAFNQAPVASFYVLVRCGGDPHTLGSALHAAALQILPGQMFVGTPQSGGEIASESSARLRFTTVLLSVFACLALLLGIVGIYGLVSHYTVQRTHEVGIRIALGATPKNVLRHVLKEGMTMVGLGLVIGLAIAFALTRGMSSMLYEVRPMDVSAVSIATLLLLIAALAANYIPAHRASKVDPIVALRYE